MAGGHQNRPQNDLKMTPKSIPKRAPEGQNDPQERPRSSQDDPKTTPRAPRSAPGVTWGRSWEPFSSPAVAKSRQEPPRMPPGSPFGAILAPFLTLQELIFKGFADMLSRISLVCQSCFQSAHWLCILACCQLGGRFWGACPCEIRPPSIT